MAQISNPNEKAEETQSFQIKDFPVRILAAIEREAQSRSPRVGRNEYVEWLLEQYVEGNLVFAEEAAA